MTRRALGAAELGNVGNATFVSAGAGGGGAAGGLGPCDADTLLPPLASAALLPPPPPPPLAPTPTPEAVHVVFRPDFLRKFGVDPVDCGCDC